MPIHSHIQELGNEALDNYDHAAMPRFQGNEQVPIQVNISPQQLVGSLQEAASGHSAVQSEAKQMLQILAEEHSGWNISAGVHEGGLGGGGRAPDPNPHITVSTGHHVGLDDKDRITRITGNGIEGRPTKTSGPSNTEQRLSDLKERHGLSDTEALKVIRAMKSDGITENQAVAKVKGNR